MKDYQKIKLLLLNYLTILKSCFGWLVGHDVSIYKQKSIFPG